MPTKRTRRARNRRAEIPDDLRSWLADENPKYTGFYFLTDLELRAAWNKAKDEILEDWAREEPGARPRYWWQYEAPEPRRRLGGTGTPSYEVSAYVEHYEWGLPDHWVTQPDVDRPGGDFAGVAIDPSDPPRFESEAAYLGRLGLFLPGELERLSEADFEPELIMPEEGDAGAEAEPPDQAA